MVVLPAAAHTPLENIARHILRKQGVIGVGKRDGFIVIAEYGKTVAADLHRIAKRKSIFRALARVLHLLLRFAHGFAGSAFLS